MMIRFSPDRRLIYVLLLLAVVSGCYLRSYHLGERSLWIDEGYSINAADAVISGGFPIFGSGAVYLSGIANTYSIAASILVFGFDPNNPWATRLPSVVFGTIGIVAIFFLAKRIFKSLPVAVTSSLFWALSTWEIGWARQARGYSGMQLFLIIFFLFFSRWLESRRRSDLYASCAFLIISIMFHPAAFVVIIPLLATLSFDLKVNLKKMSGNMPQVVIITLSVVSLISFLVLTAESYNFLPSPMLASYLLKTYPIIVFGFLGLIILRIVSKSDRTVTVMLVSSVVLPVVIFSVYWRMISDRYLLVVFPLLVICAAALTFELIVKSRLKNVSASLIIGMMIFLVVSINVISLQATAFVNLEPGSPQPDFKSAYSYILENRNEGDIVISPYPHMTSIYTGSSGYWLANYTQDNNKWFPKETDFYTGARGIRSIDELLDLMRVSSGYLVIDSPIQVRIGQEDMSRIFDETPTRKFWISKVIGNSIAVLRFN